MNNVSHGYDPNYWDKRINREKANRRRQQLTQMYRARAANLLRRMIHEEIPDLDETLKYYSSFVRAKSRTWESIGRSLSAAFQIDIANGRQAYNVLKRAIAAHLQQRDDARRNVDLSQIDGLI